MRLLGRQETCLECRSLPRDPDDRQDDLPGQLLIN